MICHEIRLRWIHTASRRRDGSLRQLDVICFAATGLSGLEAERFAGLEEGGLRKGMYGRMARDILA